ncbi:glycoside hydrolase [bacterium]|nr:glycoside hydrolase [bacterium]MCI0606373.1 glycoside hydrolase [bacterium]
MLKRFSSITFVQVFLIPAIAILCAWYIFAGLAHAATMPASGTISPTDPTITYTGGPFALSYPYIELTGDDPPACAADTNCGEFALTVDIPQTDFNTYLVKLKVAWTNSGTTTRGKSASDYDVYVYSPDNLTGSQTSSAASQDNPEETTFEVVSGLYTIYVVPFDVSPTVPFNATVTLVRVGPWPPLEGTTPVPPGTPRFFNYAAPPGLADDAGEPTLGINWNTEKIFGGIPNGGTVNFFGGFLPHMLRVIFDDTTSPATVTWETAPLTLANAPRVFGDPILFTDPVKGRTFVSQLIGLTPLGSTTEWTDDDGRTGFLPSEGSGLPSNIDHQTFGGGPFHEPIPTGVNPLYGHAVYYCSQSVAEAGCSLSVDGGITFLPFVPMYTSADCAGLHGHIKVGPDGTVYVPNKGCGPEGEGQLDDPLFHANGRQAVIVSEDNGLTWDIRMVPTADTSSERDPSVAVARDSKTLYFAYQAKNGHQHVAVSHDKGLTWPAELDVDVGAQLGIENSQFPAAVAGDPERAAVAFFGTKTPGTDYDQAAFSGVWYLYVATTLDGGKTWVTQNVTPGDPIQRGGICDSGGCRNLLDFFDAGIDKEGRVLIAYDDGCISEGCISGQRSYGMNASNDFTARAVIARQASGKRMFPEFDFMAGDDINPAPPPPPPPHATSCDGNVATDAAGDAVHPLLSSNGGNRDQVDITGLSFGLSEDKQNMVTTITLKNLSTTPITGSSGTFYYAVWTRGQKNADGSVAGRTYATRVEISANNGTIFRFGPFDPSNDAFITSEVVTGSVTPGENGTVKVNVPLVKLGNPTIPVTDLTSVPAVIEPYALTIILEVALRFVQPADRAPNPGSFGANWAVCLAPTVVCMEDDDPSISYSDGWHLVSDSDASGGHFRLHAGKSPSHSASANFVVAAGQTGKITYYYATSPKGGTAEIFLDGVSKGTISYLGSAGSTRDPAFGSKVEFANLAAGAHILEIKNMKDAVYVDRFCLESATSSGSPATGPGQTTSDSNNLNAGQEATSIVNVGSNATAISVVAETSTNLPIKVLLIDPSGSVLNTADNTSGFVVISAPVSQSGAYVVKVVNLNLGPVAVWSAITPTLRR